MGYVGGAAWVVPKLKTKDRLPRWLGCWPYVEEGPFDHDEVPDVATAGIDGLNTEDIPSSVYNERKGRTQAVDHGASPIDCHPHDIIRHMNLRGGKQGDGGRNTGGSENDEAPPVRTREPVYDLGQSFPQVIGNWLRSCVAHLKTIIRTAWASLPPLQ